MKSIYKTNKGQEKLEDILATLRLTGKGKRIIPAEDSTEDQASGDSGESSGEFDEFITNSVILTGHIAELARKSDTVLERLLARSSRKSYGTGRNINVDCFGNAIRVNSSHELLVLPVTHEGDILLCLGMTFLAKEPTASGITTAFLFEYPLPGVGFSLRYSLLAATTFSSYYQKGNHPFDIVNKGRSLDNLYSLTSPGFDHDARKAFTEKFDCIGSGRFRSIAWREILNLKPYDPKFGDLERNSFGSAEGADEPGTVPHKNCRLRSVAPMSALRETLPAHAADSFSPGDVRLAMSKTLNNAFENYRSFIEGKKVRISMQIQQITEELDRAIERQESIYRQLDGLDNNEVIRDLFKGSRFTDPQESGSHESDSQE